MKTFFINYLDRDICPTFTKREHGHLLGVLGVAVTEWLSSWLVEQEVRGSIPRLATWIFRDWLSPASKSRYGWNTAKTDVNSQYNQLTTDILNNNFTNTHLGTSTLLFFVIRNAYVTTHNNNERCITFYSEDMHVYNNKCRISKSCISMYKKSFFYRPLYYLGGPLSYSSAQYWIWFLNNVCIWQTSIKDDVDISANDPKSKWAPLL